MAIGQLGSNPVGDYKKRRLAIVRDLGGVSLKSYTEAKRIAERAYRRAGEADKKLIGGMVSDCEYVIEYLETGYPPNRRRDDSRLSKEQRAVKEVAALFKFLPDEYPNPVDCSYLTDEDRDSIDQVLSILTYRQRECFVMVRGGLSFDTVAQMLGIAKSTVESHVEDAETKIKRHLGTGGFLF